MNRQEVREYIKKLLKPIETQNEQGILLLKAICLSITDIHLIIDLIIHDYIFYAKKYPELVAISKKYF